MDAAWKAWHQSGLQAKTRPVQPDHENTLIIRSGAAWDSLDCRARQRLVRASELAVADGFVFSQQILLYAFRQLRRHQALDAATCGIIGDKLVHLASFRRYAREAPECTTFFGSALPGQLGRRHMPRTTAALCWLLRREPRCLYIIAPHIGCIGLAYGRQLMQDRSDVRDPWRALQALHLRDAADHVGAYCRLLANLLAPLSCPARARLWLYGSAASMLLGLATLGNQRGAWRLAWTEPPPWPTRLQRLYHVTLGHGGHRRLYAVALRRSLTRQRLLLTDRVSRVALWLVERLA